MATLISWNDPITGSSGALNNSKPPPADRFASWQPKSPDPGPGAHGLGTGARYKFAFGTRYGATFELQYIPRTSMDLMDALVVHLDLGGTVTVETGDTVSSTYATCCLTEGAELPYPAMMDRKNIEYVMKFALTNLGATPMLCTY